MPVLIYVRVKIASFSISMHLCASKAQGNTKCLINYNRIEHLLNVFINDKYYIIQLLIIYYLDAQFFKLPNF